MMRIRLAGLAIATAGLIGAVAWASGSLDRPLGGVWTTTAGAQHKVSPATGGSRGGVATASAAAGGGKSAKPAGPKRPGPHATPAPFVQEFAGQPGITRQRPGRKPTKPVKVAVTVDGCDRNYGRRVQCIPVTFPAAAGDKCAWLQAHGYQNVPVVGKDRQHLDADRNGIACDG